MCKNEPMRTNFCFAVASIFLSLLSACASLDGRGLVPGKSTTAEIQGAMGAPAERLKRQNGDELWYYVRHPEGRVSYAITVGADGVMRTMEQRLGRENFAKIVVGKSTRDEVRELLGPPSHVLHLRLKAMDVWEYPWREIDEKRVLYVGFTGDGIVREVREAHDAFSDRPSID